MRRPPDRGQTCPPRSDSRWPRRAWPLQYVALLAQVDQRRTRRVWQPGGRGDEAGEHRAIRTEQQREDSVSRLDPYRCQTSSDDEGTLVQIAFDACHRCRVVYLAFFGRTEGRELGDRVHAGCRVVAGFWQRIEDAVVALGGMRQQQRLRVAEL